MNRLLRFAGPIRRSAFPMSSSKAPASTAAAACAKDYDLFVIGGGSGGVRAARIAAGYGARVAMAEKQLEHGAPGFSALGGTCVNVGCVPKKLMVYGSEYAHKFDESRGYGWDTPQDHPGLDWARFMSNKDAEISRLNGVYGRMLGSAGVNVIEGTASLLDANTVMVGDKSYTAENILVAVGGWPFVPDFPGNEHVITSNEAFYLKELPRRTLVVGGGYIAVEFACIFAGFGSNVTLSYRGDLFLRGFDGDCREHTRVEMERQGIDLAFGTNVASIERIGGEGGTLRVCFAPGEDGTARELEVDAVMYATGRVPLTSELGLEKAGVNVVPAGERGAGSIPVDEWSRTNVPNIYAVGDVTDRIQLTPVALHEGHCLADTLFGGKPRTPDHTMVASAVFCQPPIGTVGLSEEDARKEYGDENVIVFRSSFRPMKHTLSGSDERSLMKIVVHAQTDKVLGVHICTPEAAEIIQGVAIAVKAGATKADFDATIGVHPSSAEELVTMRTPVSKV